jgi:hypothetical protein
MIFLRIMSRLNEYFPELFAVYIYIYIYIYKFILNLIKS